MDSLPKLGLFSNFPNEFRRDLELDGMTIIEPDGKTFASFSLKHWHMQSFLARRGDCIYVPLILARKPQHGALSRLLNEIEGQSLRVAVIAPLGILTTILRNWGFTERREYVCGSIEDVWRGPKKEMSGNRR